MDENSPRQPLDYVTPVIPPNEPSPLAAALLCCPGLICWVIFFAGMNDRLPFLEMDSPAVLGTWILAAITAITSFFLFAQKRKRWYVVLNLILNALGLAFSALLLLALWSASSSNFG